MPPEQSTAIQPAWTEPDSVERDSSLPAWFTSMQAVAWISTRNFAAVWRADLRRGFHTSRKTPESWTDDWFPPGVGLSLIHLDAWHAREHGNAQWTLPGNEGLTKLMDWLRSDQVRSTGRRRGRRTLIDAGEWEDMELDVRTPIDAHWFQHLRTAADLDLPGPTSVFPVTDLFRLCPPRGSVVESELVENKTHRTC